MKAKRFQITLFNVQSAQYSRVADQAVVTGQSWEDICLRMTKSEDANVQYASAAIAATGSYSFHTESGELATVVPQDVEAS